MSIRKIESKMREALFHRVVVTTVKGNRWEGFADEVETKYDTEDGYDHLIVDIGEEEPERSIASNQIKDIEIFELMIESDEEE
ncbi:MAG: hypothetical protein IKQ92_13200 [Clostridia bacterium]|nr:hypothetical protein [Clostridia bacterium]